MVTPRLSGVPILHSDESLNGFVARLTKNYVFEMPQHLLAAIEVDATGMSELHRDKASIASLEGRLGLQVGDLARRRYSPSKRKISGIQFAGQEIRGSVFAGHAPRIPPHTFKRLGYHRMCWDLAFVIADPDTGERLISVCPSCDARLRWSRPDFFRCHSCSEPLTKAPPSIVPNDVRLSAAIFSGLLSFDKEVTIDARKCFAPELRRMEAGLLLQSLYELSSRPISERKGRGAVPVTVDWEAGLIRMLQLSIGWPAAILGLIDELTAGGRRRQDKNSAAFKYGRLRRILPAWGAIPQVHGVAIPVSRALETGDIENYRPHPRFLRGNDDFAHPAGGNLFAGPYEWFQKTAALLSRSGENPAERKIEDELGDLASLEMVRIRWGLERDAVLELTDAGYLNRVDYAFHYLTGTDEALYRLSEIECFFLELQDRYEAVPRSTRRIGFTSVLSKIRSKIDKPYSRIIQAILDGSFRPIRIKEKARTGLERLQFGAERADEWVREQLRPGTLRGKL